MGGEDEAIGATAVAGVVETSITVEGFGFKVGSDICRGFGSSSFFLSSPIKDEKILR